MKLSKEQLLEKLEKARQNPKFSAKELLDIGIGGSNVAGLPNLPSKKAFGKKNRSVPPAPKASSPKIYVPFGKSTEL